MPAPRFITNSAYGAPGMYIRELKPDPIVRGIQRFTVGIAGVCVRGPKDKAVAITSPARFFDVFGGRDYGAGGAIVGEVWKALINKNWGDLVIIRAVAADAVKASFTAETAAGGGGTQVLLVEATSHGLWGNDVAFRVHAATDGDANKFNLTVRYLGKFKTYENLNISGANDNLAAVVGDDDANWVKLSKLAAGRPVNHAATVDGADADGYVNLGEAVAGFTSVAGSNGTIADADFTAAGRALDVLANYKGLGIAFVAGRSNAAIKSALLTKSAASNDRLFLVCPDAANTTQAAAITEVATMRDDRLVYCFNHPTTLDPETAETITTEPHAWMANILNQTDADVHPGDADNKDFLAGIRGLTYEGMAAGDYDALDAAGICALERHHKGGFVFVSGVTTSLVKNDRPIDGRRTKDFIISGAVERLEGSNKKPNTKGRREADRGALVGWLTGLAKQERFVAKTSKGQADIIVANDETVNLASDWADGLHKTFLRVRTIPQNLVMELDFLGGPAVPSIEVSEG